MKFESIIISCTPIICAFIGQKYLFKLFNFNYDVFNDSFDIAKLLIDFGVFMALFFCAALAIDRFKKDLKRGYDDTMDSK